MEIEKQLTQTAILRKEAERKIIEAETGFRERIIQ